MMKWDEPKTPIEEM